MGNFIANEGLSVFVIVSIFNDFLLLASGMKSVRFCCFVWVFFIQAALSPVSH